MKPTAEATDRDIKYMVEWLRKKGCRSVYSLKDLEQWDDFFADFWLYGKCVLRYSRYKFGSDRPALAAIYEVFEDASADVYSYQVWFLESVLHMDTY